MEKRMNLLSDLQHRQCRTGRATCTARTPVIQIGA